MPKSKRIPGVLKLAALPLLVAILAAQISAPVLDQPYAGDRNVTGQGLPASGPLTVFDVTSNSKIYLGAGNSIDQQGFFAVAVDPPLAVGHKIVVADSQGHTSAVASVVAKTGTPTGPQE